MSFFKRIFRSKNASTPYDAFPDIPIAPIALPELKRRRSSVGKYVLEDKLAKLTQVRPQRVAVLWQGVVQEESKFYAFIKTNEENQNWLLDRLGGEEVIEDISWDHLQSIRVLLGLSRELSCLAFSFTLKGRYLLKRRLLADEKQEIWLAKDKELKQDVLCTIVKKANGKFPEEFISRPFEVEGKLVSGEYPGLLNVLDEGYVKALGPFAYHRYKIPRLLYVITQAPPSLVPATALIARRTFHLEEGIAILYQIGRLITCLQEKGWTHGQITARHLWLDSGESQPTVYLNGFSLAKNDSTIVESLHAGKVDPHADQLALGAAVYHLACGKELDSAKIPPLYKVVSRFPVWFSDLLAKMTELSPEKRFSDLRDMINALAKELKNPEGAEGEEIISASRKKPEKSKASPKKKAVKKVRADAPQKKAPAIPKRDQALVEERLEPLPEKDPQPEFPQQAVEFPEIEEVTLPGESDDQSALDDDSGEEIFPVQETDDDQFDEWSESDFEEFVASPPVMDSYLLCSPFQPFLLPEDRPFRIGRGEDNDLILSAGDVSNFHAAIFKKNEKYRIKDQNSSNGTKVNGKPVSEQVLVKGDKIAIAANTLVYREIQRGRSPDEASKSFVRKKTLQMPSLRKGKADVQSSLSGDLSQISLWQVLQILAGEEKTGGLTITNGDKTHIFFVNGLIVQCESGKEKGREVFYAQVLRQDGRFEFDPDLAPEEVSMSDPVESLLLETARRLDEQERMQ